ncbi:MAG: tRNA pseudouridine(55) synthase TruB [Pseudomonadota bacterium]
MARQRKRKGDPVHGWLVLDKPIDMTSTQAVGLTKRLLGAQKAGHGGTLDPLASGILPIAFGEATKTAAWAMDAEKEYVFTIEWGTSTDSQDKEGAVIATSKDRPTLDQVEAALEAYRGEIEQVPPKFSAIKVDGERAYDLARGGEEFELESRPVTIHSAKVMDMPDADHTEIHVLTGKGFYVRALARDLAFDLGCEGHISALRRTRVGDFTLEDAVTPDALDEMVEVDARRSTLLPLETALDDLPPVDLAAGDAELLKQGRTVKLMPHVIENWRADLRSDREDRLAVAMDDGQALALGEVRAGQFKPTRVFQV